MSNIEHQLQGGKLMIRTYPANGERYDYIFDESGELVDKFHVSNSDMYERDKKRVAPNLTPRVKEYLREQGFDY